MSVGGGSSYNTNSNNAWKLKTPFGLRALGVGIAVVNFMFILVLFLSVDADPVALWLTILLMTVVGVFGTVLAWSYIDLSIDASHLRAGLWSISKRVVPLASLQEYFHVKDVRPSSFGGVGFCKAQGNRTAYLWGRGPGLEVRTVAGETITVVFDKVDEAVHVLDETTEIR